MSRTIPRRRCTPASPSYRLMAVRLTICTGACTAQSNKMAVLRDNLGSYRTTVTPRLWKDLRKIRPDDSRILPMAGLLALFDPANSQWSEFGNKVAREMVLAPIDRWRGWREALASVRRAAPGTPSPTSIEIKVAPMWSTRSRPRSCPLRRGQAETPRQPAAGRRAQVVLHPVPGRGSKPLGRVLRLVRGGHAGRRLLPGRSPRSDRVSADNRTRSAEEGEAARDRQAACGPSCCGTRPTGRS